MIDKKSSKNRMLSKLKETINHNFDKLLVKNGPKVSALKGIIFISESVKQPIGSVNEVQSVYSWGKDFKFPSRQLRSVPKDEQIANNENSTKVPINLDKLLSRSGLSFKKSKLLLAAMRNTKTENLLPVRWSLYAIISVIAGPLMLGLKNVTSKEKSLFQLGSMRH